MTEDLQTTCHVLVVDDEAAMREVLRARLERWGHRVDTAEGVGDAERRLQQCVPDVVISDLVMPDGTGIDLARRHHRPDRLFVVVTAYGTVDTAVAAMKGGATEFLTKPLDYQQLRGILEAHMARRSLHRAARESEPGRDLLVGTSSAMRAVREQIEAVAPSSTTVMVVGESGTGKELVARSIVARSQRAERPFLAVNAAAISGGTFEAELLGHERGAFTGADAPREGYFEQAHGGTLFLDEVTEMPLALQPKLLRVLEDGRVRRLGARQERDCDVRILAATNRYPEEAVEEGYLRRDLFHRLCVFRIDLPPLRDRREDIPLLTHQLLERIASREGRPRPEVTSRAMETLFEHRYPGNVRELRNLLERAMILAGDGPIDRGHVRSTPPAPEPNLPPATDGITLPAQVTAAEAERILIAETLKRTNNNKSETARRLGLDVKTVRKKLKSVGPGT